MSEEFTKTLHLTEGEAELLAHILQAGAEHLGLSNQAQIWLNSIVVSLLPD